MSHTGQGLNVNTPFTLIEAKNLKGPFLAECLGLIYELIPSVVSGPGITFRIFVLHVRAKGVHDRSRSKVLRHVSLNRKR